MNYIIVIVLGYLLGTINPAYLISKHKNKIDIREVNSKNAGTSNMAITFGLKWGVLVGILDIFKGFLPVFILRFIFPDNDVLWILGGLSAIMGHLYPFYLGFKGGKGTATFGGLVLGLMPIHALILLMLFFVVLFISDFIAIATLFVIIVVPIVMFFLDFSYISIVLVVLYSSISFYKHYPNYKRIYLKEELGLKAAFKKKKDKP